MDKDKKEWNPKITIEDISKDTCCWRDEQDLWCFCDEEKAKKWEG